MTSLEVVNQKLEDVTKVAQENIAIAFKNMDSIENIEEQSAILKEYSQKFAAKSHSLKIKSCWESYKLNIGFLIMLILILILILLMIIYS